MKIFFIQRTKIAVTVVIGLFPVIAFSQHDSVFLQLKSYTDYISAFSYYYPQEKVYLHFDNTGYYPGETIFFQSYVVAAGTHAPSKLSGVLYVELLDAAGNIVEGKKLKPDTGRAPGDFILKNDMRPGFYEIRAYTRSMLNFGGDCVFSRVFPVFSRPRQPGAYTLRLPDNTPQPGKNEKRKKKELSRINLSFYPEGGYLVTGLTGKVAVKATGNRGENIEVTGTVYHPSGTAAATFASLHQGMGFFELCPDGSEYTVEVTSGNRTERFTLPAALPAGYALQADNRKESLSVRVSKTSGLSPETLGISLACRGRVYAFESFETGNGEHFRFDFSKAGLPPGVYQLTLFNAGGDILAERLAFINNGDKLRITPVNITSGFTPLSPISIDFSVSDTAGHPVQSSFSLSVRDRAKETPSGYSGNIMTELLLSSDLKGYIETPAWYFEGGPGQRSHILDLLMLTQGWRRYPWDVMAGRQPFGVSQGMEKGLLVEGRVLEATRDRPLKNAEVTMWAYSGDGLSQRGRCPADEDGSFNFALEDFYGIWDLSLQAKEKGKRRHSRILLERDHSPEPKIFGYAETQIPERRVDESPEQEKQHPALSEALPEPDIVLPDTVRRIEEVTISAKRRWRRDGEGLLYADVVYDVEEELDKTRDEGKSEPGSFIDFLLDKPEFSYAENFPHAIRDMVGRATVYIPTMIYKSKPVVFVVNNMPAWFVSMIQLDRENIADCGERPPGSYFIVNDLITDEVETVMIDESGKSAEKHVPRCYINEHLYVVVYVYTNGDGKRRTDTKGIRTTKLQGFSRPAEFYSPDYSQIPLPDEKDFRRTLYWNPEVKTDSEGKATVRFYNNSTCKKITISAETLADDGRTGAIQISP